MSRLADVEVFVRVVETGSYTAAARALGISKSYASKQVRSLEERLGIQLIHRTTRTLTPTDAGRNFAARCAALLEELDGAERDVAALQKTAAGTLRISVPMSFGVAHVAPVIGRFLQDHPELDILADYDDSFVDLVDGGYDLAVRIGSLPDSSLRARRLAPNRVRLAASPAYLAENGTPESPEDLRDHTGLLYTLNRTPASWSLAHHGTGEVARVRMRSRMTCNTGEALLAAVEAGVGICPLPEFLMADSVRAGRTTLVLPEWSLQASNSGIWVVYPPDRRPAVKVTAFVEALAAAVDGQAWTLG